jgi:Cu+-exporting ATPase
VAVTRIVKGNQHESISLSRLKEGDKILIRNQELVPADSKLIGGQANIDYSFVTGESLPVEKKVGDFIFAGGRQMGSSIELEVVKSVEQSYLTQLWNQDNSKGESVSKLDPVINKVSQYFTAVVLAVASFAGIYWLFNDPSVALFAFTSVLIIACPCALALTVPFTFGSTMRVFGRKGLYIKNTAVIENLHKVDTIVFDKTGTITQSHSLKVSFVGDSLSEEQQKIIKSLTSHSSHPHSLTISKSIDIEDLYPVESFVEIPAMGLSGIIKGQRVNVGSRKFVMGSGEENALKAQVYVFIEDRVLGYYQIENQYREGLEEVVNHLSRNFSLYVLSGDNDAEKENLQKIFGEQVEMYFHQSPPDKMDFVKKLKADGKTVLMIGDGLNDAGALIESHVGISVADDVYHFSPACDAIIESNKFGNLHRFILFTHKSMAVVWLSFLLSFLYNTIGLYFAVQGHLSPIIAAILMPISSVSVVLFASLSVKFLSKDIH